MQDPNQYVESTLGHTSQTLHHLIAKLAISLRSLGHRPTIHPAATNQSGSQDLSGHRIPRGRDQRSQDLPAHSNIVHNAIHDGCNEYES